MKPFTQLVFEVSVIVIAFAVGTVIVIRERRKVSQFCPSAPSIPQEKPRVEVSKSTRPFQKGEWVRHDDGDLGLIEETRPDGLYRVRIKTDRDGKPVSWYEAKVWRLALPKTREWWCNTQTGVLFQPSEDWTTYEGDKFHYEPVNWGKG